NRAEMDAGGESSWSERIFPGDISSLQSAYNKRADVGEDAFFSEYQNQPRRESANIYELTRDTVLSRLSGFRRGEIAADANYLVVASDVNYFGLTWVALAVRNDFCGFVADYGVWPGDGKDIVTNKASEEAEIYEALSEYLAFIRNKFDRISALGIDGNRFTVPVQKFVLQNRRQLPFNLWDLRGHAATNYRPLQKDSPRLIGTNRTRCHLQKSANYADVFEGLFDSYYWHVVMQKSFLVSPGGRGSTSIYGDGRASHADFADQICADRLKDIYERGGQLRYEWQTVGRNDYGDALTMAQVLANLLGVEVDGVPAARKRPPAKRRAARVG
ncbi:MAG: terminase gpA endonuclease subunit, partial [Victivallaceae bacterium]